MDLKTAERLVWKKILMEDKENFTPEFQEQVIETLKIIMGID